MSSSEMNQRLTSLRQVLQQFKNPPISAYTLRTTDAHNSEYMADRYKRIQFISGFSGSNAQIVVTDKQALLWTDGRYFEQANKQLDPRLWTLMKMGVAGFPSRDEWLKQNLKENQKVAFDGDLVTIDEHLNLCAELSNNEFEGVTAVSLSENPVDKVWGSDRPSLPSAETARIFEQSIELYAGESVKSKLERVRKSLKMAADDKKTVLVLNSLDEIAWLFNIRGSDIPYNPFFMSYAIITGCSASVYLDKSKFSDEAHFSAQTGVDVLDYDQFDSDFAEFARSADLVYVPKTANYSIATKAKLAAKMRVLQSPVAVFKAIKNKTEIKGMKRAHVLDAVAMCEFLFTLETSNPGTFDELSAEKFLIDLRSKQETYVFPSFRTISGYGANGAIIHYGSSDETNTKIMDDNLYLVDSGGQYLHGTTDITRTIHLGTPSQHQKHCFTSVLMGHLDLAAVKFPIGTSGHRLDTIARAPMWKQGLDYQHGTGHGVGSFLGVHEGPFSISQNPNAATEIMKPGFCLSDEPGYYETGKFGIRIENLLLCVDAPKHNKGGRNMPEFLGFEFLTLVPIQKKLIVKEMLSDEQINTLNEYHATVAKVVGAELQKQEKPKVLEWLKLQTQPL